MGGEGMSQSSFLGKEGKNKALPTLPSPHCPPDFWAGCILLSVIMQLLGKAFAIQN
jgi:hypothetical protein